METALLATGIVGAIGTDILKTTFHNAIYGLQSSLLFIKNGSRENELFKNVHDKIRVYDLEMKFFIAHRYTEKLSNEIINQYIISSINKINNLTEVIRLKINNHKEKWFHVYRTCDILYELNELDQEVKIFDKRLDILVNYSKSL